MTMVGPEHVKAAAVKYGRHHLRVFPVHSVDSSGRCTCGCADPACTTRGKHPRIRKWQEQATADPLTINHWWSEWPDANIGLVMAPDLIGIDVDPRNGGDETWRDISAQHGGFVDTWQAQSGGGGAHYIFRVPEGCTPRTDTLGPGVDVKYHGYLLVEPSVHLSGGVYTWDVTLAPGTMPPADLPASLAAQISRPGPTIDRLVGDVVRDAERRQMAALIAEDCPEGERHTRTASIAGMMRHFNIGLPEAEALLLVWNKGNCKPPRPEAEVLFDVRDIYGRYAPGDAPATVSLDAPLVETAPDGATTSAFQDIGVFLTRKPPRWLVEDYLVSGSYAAIVGPPGAGKSLLAIEMALSLANGLPMFGHRVRPGRVLYVLAEGQGGFGQRVLAWQEARLARNVLRPAPEGQFIVLPVAVNLSDPAAVRVFLEQAKAYAGEPRLVVFDTLNQNMGGANENDSEAMGAVNTAARAIRAVFPEATVLLLHHGRKADGKIRGHSSLEGALDTIIGVEQETAGIVTVRSIKQKDGGELAKERFALRPVNVEFLMHRLGLLDTEPVAEGDIVIPPITTSVVLQELKRSEQAHLLMQARIEEDRRRPLPAPAAILGRLLLDAGLYGAQREHLRLMWLKQADAQHYPRTYWNRALAGLLKRGLIEERDQNTVVWLVPLALERLRAAVVAAETSPQTNGGEEEE